MFLQNIFFFFFGNFFFFFFFLCSIHFHKYLHFFIENFFFEKIKNFIVLLYMLVLCIFFFKFLSRLCYSREKFLFLDIQLGLIILHKLVSIEIIFYDTCLD